jgi:hypothetical protein
MLPSYIYPHSFGIGTVGIGKTRSARLGNNNRQRAAVAKGAARVGRAGNAAGHEWEALLRPDGKLCPGGRDRQLPPAALPARPGDKEIQIQVLFPQTNNSLEDTCFSLWPGQYPSWPMGAALLTKAV